MRRRRGEEWLDDPAIDPAIRARSLRDVVRSNGWLGGRRAAVGTILDSVREANGQGHGARSVTLLDVGTGLADIPGAVARTAAREGIAIITIGVDTMPSLLGAARRSLTHIVCASATALPFAEGSIDVTSASQLLHHFDDEGAPFVVRELHRVARRAVVISDLRRSWTAAAGFWAVSWPLRFHRVTRHDGVVSVLRGFTAQELSRLIERAIGITPTVVRRIGFRLTARWPVPGRDRA